MKKRIFSLLLAALMLAALLPASVFAASDFESTYIPNGISTPKAAYLVYEEDDLHSDYIHMWYNPSEELRDLEMAYERYIASEKDFEEYFGVYGFNTKMQIDVKIDGGNWQYTSDWDDPDWSGVEAPTDLAFRTNLSPDASRYYSDFEVSWLTYLEEGYFGFLAPIVYAGTNEYDETVYHYDLSGHTLSVRYRFGICVEPEYGTRNMIFSEWSPVTSIGKNGNQKALTAPASLAAPVLSEFSVSVNEEGGRDGNYFINFPDSVFNAMLYCQVEQDVFEPLYIQAQMRVNGGEWQDVYTANPVWIFDGFRSAAPDGGLKASDSVEVRVRLESDCLGLVSPWSNIVGTKTYQTGSFYLPIMIQADELGLIPSCLDGVDLTQPISRAEFAAVAVKVYESLSGKTATAGAAFADCDDMEVRKAVAIGITNGTDAKKNLFSPNDTITREQAATMLTRAFKAYAFSGWTLSTDKNFDAQFKALYTMPKTFDDDSTINGYAKDSVYFMVANGIINGMGFYEADGVVMYNAFLPRNLIYRDQAAQIGLATREQALTIAVRMVQNLK